MKKRDVLDEKIVEDDGDFSFARRVVSSQGCPELYYAWILDFENDGLEKSPYKVLIEIQLKDMLIGWKGKQVRKYLLLILDREIMKEY